MISLPIFSWACTVRSVSSSLRFLVGWLVLLEAMAVWWISLLSSSSFVYMLTFWKLFRHLSASVLMCVWQTTWSCEGKQLIGFPYIWRNHSRNWHGGSNWKHIQRSGSLRLNISPPYLSSYFLLSLSSLHLPSTFHITTNHATSDASGILSCSFVVLLKSAKAYKLNRIRGLQFISFLIIVYYIWDSCLMNMFSVVALIIFISWNLLGCSNLGWVVEHGSAYDTDT